MTSATVANPQQHARELLGKLYQLYQSLSGHLLKRFSCSLPSSDFPMAP